MAPPGRLTWLGHATVLIELDGTRVLTDPILRDRVAHLVRHSPSPARVPQADAVLLSHEHLDHVHGPSLRMLDSDVEVLAPTGTRDRLARLGLHRVREMRAGDEARVGALTVRAVPAVHEVRRHPLANRTDALGFLVSGSRRVYFAGDTDEHPAMADLAGDLDVALLPIWGWGPTIGPGHMDPDAAARAARVLAPRVAVPIHWGTLFPIGLRRWRGAALRDPPRRFTAAMAQTAPDVTVRVLAPGDGMDL